MRQCRVRARAGHRRDMTPSHVFVSAWNDSGGGYLARLLDGHPELAVYPFELQLGTGLAPCGFDEWFPAKYRWPVLPADPREAFDAFANEELRAALDPSGTGKFAGYSPDLDVDEWRRTFERLVVGHSGRGEVVAAWLSAFFEVFGGDDDPNRTVVGHCPVLALDWDLIHADLPDARMLHVVRSPFAGFSDTIRRRPTMGTEGYSTRWSLVNTVAALHAARDPDRFRIVRYEALLCSPEAELTAITRWLGLEFDASLLTPSWNGAPLEQMGPFGGVPVNTEEYERANIAALGKEQRAAISDWTGARASPRLDRGSPWGRSTR